MNPTLPGPSSNGEPGFHSTPASARGRSPRSTIAPHSLADWRSILDNVKRKFVADQLSVVAGNVAFSGVIAIFPVLIAIISAYGIVSDPKDVAHQLNTLSATMPAAARALLYDQVKEIVESSGEKLGLGVLVSLATTLIAGSGGMHALIDGINRAHDRPETRSYVRIRLLALALTVAVVVFTVTALGLITVLPHALEFIGLATLMKEALTFLRWPALVLAVMVGLSVLYRYAPNRARPRWHWLSLGGVFATAVWLLASLGFGVYASHFASYNKTYGALAGMVVFMLWVYISTLAILVGAELNAELESRFESSDIRDVAA